MRLILQRYSMLKTKSQVLIIMCIFNPPANTECREIYKSRPQKCISRDENQIRFKASTVFKGCTQNAQISTDA